MVRVWGSLVLVGGLALLEPGGSARGQSTGAATATVEAPTIANFAADGTTIGFAWYFAKGANGGL